VAEAQEDSPLSTEILGNSARVASATAINAVVSGASTIIVARTLGAASFGQFTYWVFVMGLVAGLSEFGVNTRGVSVLARAWPAGDTALFRAETWRMLRFGVLRALMLGVASLIVFRGHPLTAALVAAVTMLRAVGVFSFSLVAQRRFRLLTRTSVAVTLAQSIGTSWVAIATHNPALTVGVFFAGQLIDIAVGFAFAPWSLLLRRSKPRVRLPRLELRTLLAFYLLGVCQLVIFGKSETLFLHYTGQAIALGFFAIATTLAARATLLTDALYSALVPSIGAAANRDPEGAGRAYSTALRFSSILVLLTALVLGPAIVVVGPLILGASGGTVRVATALTLGGSLLQTFIYPLTAIAAVEMQRSAVALPALLGALFDIVGAIVLVPSYGLTGAAIASLLGALGFGLGFSLAVRLHGAAARTLREQLLRVAAMIAALIVSAVATQTLGPVVSCAAMWIAALGVYALCGLGGGVLLSADIERLRSALPRAALRVFGVSQRLLNHALLVAKTSLQPEM
jgi:O-antigen/teichoic acid export membrane protein